jgi:hypothetical protein
MSTNQQLSFLQGKIKEIGSAIFFNLSDSVLKLPTSIVSTLKVDDYGYVWFYMQKPRQDLAVFEQEFPVRLDFFKKGASFFLQVSGKGWVVNDPEELNTLNVSGADGYQLMTDVVLVKVKILKGEYYESRTGRISWWKQAATVVTSWFRNNNHYRPETYFPAS